MFRRLLPLLCLMLLLPAMSFAQWTPLATGIFSRFEGQSALHNGKIYIFTGFKAGILIVPQTECYDIATNTWSQKASFPLSKLESNSDQAGVTHMGCVVIGDSIWFAGGRTGHHPGPITDEVWIYDIQADAFTPGPDLPLPVAGGGMVAVGRTLHIVGGFTNACDGDQNQYHLTLDVNSWLNNPGSVSWENKLAPMPRPRNHVGITTLQGKIYFMGGQLGHDCNGGTDVSWVDRYDLATDTWTALPNLPGPRSHNEPCTFVMEGKVYLGAGEPGATSANKIAIYDPVAQTWSEPNSLFFPTDILAPSLRPYKDKLYYTHGGINGYSNPSKNAYYLNITRTPLYQLDFQLDTLKIQVYEQQTAQSEILLWAMDGVADYLAASAGFPSWLSYLSGSGSGKVDYTGSFLKVGVAAGANAPGKYHHTVQVTGAGPDVINPANQATHSAAQLVVQMEVLPAPNGVLTSADNGPGCTPVELTQYVDKVITLRTNGNTPITFSGITSSNAAEFQIITAPLPAGIAGASSTDLVVRFSPSQVGARSTTITVNHNGLNSPYQFTIDCEGAPTCSLAPGWSSSDVGAPDLFGNVCYDSPNGKYTIQAGGTDIWGNSDQFYFVSLPVTGDGEIIARVTALGNTNVWAKAGVMMRENLFPDAKNVLMAATIGNGASFQYRNQTTGSSSNNTAGGNNIPMWVRLVRQGNTFQGFFSKISNTGPWTQVGGNTNVTMNSSILVGLAVTSHDGSQLTTGVIDQLQVNFAGTLPVELSAFDAVVVNGQVNLNWTTEMEVNSSHFLVERSSDGQMFEEIIKTNAAGTTFEPVNYTETDADPLKGKSYYRLKMVDIDGTFAFSSRVEVILAGENKFACFPNPTSDVLTFSYLQADRVDAVIQVFDLNGKSIFTSGWDVQPFGQKSLSVSELPAGLYAYRILAGENRNSGLFQVIRP